LGEEFQIGRQLIQAAIPPHKNTIEPFKSYLETELRKLKVRIELGKTAEAAMVKKFRPDVAIVATGATLFTPEIPGLKEAKAVQWIDILEGRAEAGDRVVLIGADSWVVRPPIFSLKKGKRLR